MHDVQVSINGGPAQPTPQDWGGQFFGLGQFTEVSFTVITNQAENISLSWW